MVDIQGTKVIYHTFALYGTNKKDSKNMFVIRNLCQHSLSFFKQVLCLFCQHSIQLSCIILRRKNVTSD